jgi:2'-5' RNA ligase
MGLEVRIGYVGPEGPAKERLKERVREALAAAGLPMAPPEPVKPKLTVIRGGADRQ